MSKGRVAGSMGRSLPGEKRGGGGNKHLSAILIVVDAFPEVAVFQLLSQNLQDQFTRSESIDEPYRFSLFLLSSPTLASSTLTSFSQVTYSRCSRSATGSAYGSSGLKPGASSVGSLRPAQTIAAGKRRNSKLDALQSFSRADRQ